MIQAGWETAWSDYGSTDALPKNSQSRTLGVIARTMKPNVERPTLSIVEAIGVCRGVPKTVRAWIRAGGVPGYLTPGRKVLLVECSELESYTKRLGAQ